MDCLTFREIKKTIEYARSTLLGVGPMSKNCVDAAIDISNDFDIPIMLIASRRQIDNERLGGGYVNNWNTTEFADYVNDRDKKGKIILARDHGGPWQNSKEVDQNFSFRRAMDSAKDSFKSDMDAGFKILHLDPSIDIHKKLNENEILERVYELYEFCFSYSQNMGKKIIFEIGTEEQQSEISTIETLNYRLENIQAFCKKNKLPLPAFIVVQTGTKVLETRNIGTLDSPLRVENELPPEIEIPKVIELVNKFGIYMKEHNADYLTNETINWHPRLGIHAANVAPEFGVKETEAFMHILESNNLNYLVSEFIDIAYASNKWEKWIIKNKKYDKRTLAIICGHYIFSKPAFIELKEKAKKELIKKNIDIDFSLKEAIKESIMRYVKGFNLI